MNIISRIRSLKPKREEWTIFRAPGAYFDLDGLARKIDGAISALEEDRKVLQRMLIECGGLAKSRYYSKFHNKWEYFIAPGEVRNALERNRSAIVAFKRARNLCQTDPHEDHELLIAAMSEAAELAA